MKINAPNNEDVNNIAGSFDSIQAGMDESSLPFILNMLSKNFYSNPIGSIVRELTSNCFDSHVEASVEDTVVIEFSYDEEGDYISFKDVGVGLSPDRIKKVYMKWFTSTKRGTNDQIGGFGLGSKTPLAYTDHFYITTVFDKIKYSYLFSKGSSLPELDLLSEEFTEDRNGTEIKIYIHNSRDRIYFDQAIKAQLCYFDNVVVLGSNVDNDYKIYETDLFKFRNKDTYSDEMHICFGKVSYPIDWERIEETRIKVPIGVKFEIGELAVTPNREALQYTDEIRNLVKKRVKETIEQLEDLYLSQQKEYTDFGEWFQQRKVRKHITFGEYGEQDKLYLHGFDHLGKKSSLKILNDLELPISVLGDDPIGDLYQRIGAIKESKNVKNYSRYDNLTNSIIDNPSYFLIAKSANFSGIRNHYFRSANIIQKSKIKAIAASLLLKKGFVKDVKLYESYNRRNYQDPEYYETRYFDTGLSVKMYKLIKYLQAYVEDNLRSYDCPITDEMKDSFKNYQRQHDSTVKRKAEGKIFVKSLAENVDKDITTTELDAFTGIIVYGFREDKKALDSAIAFMTLQPTIRTNLTSSGYESSNYSYINKKACKIFLIAKQNEKYFKNKPNMIHVNNLYSDNKLFRKLASSYKIESLLAEYLSRYSNFDGKYFFKQMYNINSTVGQALMDLKEYYEECTSREDMAYTTKVRSDLKKAILEVAEKGNLYDEVIEEKIKIVDKFFEGAEMLRYIELTTETLPIVLKYLREKKKKVNTEYYCNVVEPEKLGVQLEFKFDPEEPKTLFKLITNAA